MSKVSAWLVPRLLTPDHVAGEIGTFWSRSCQFSWQFPHPKWVLGPPLQASGNTPLLPLQRKPRGVSLAGKVMASVFWDAKGIAFIDYTFRKAKLPMGSTMSSCWGSWERQSRQNGLKNWRMESCFTRTILLHTSLWLQWLLCVTAVVSLHFILIWHAPSP